jgi:hypothetical protein
MANQIGDVLNSLSDPAQDPVVQTENQAILGFHADLEALSDSIGVPGTFHGLTNTGETVGLGRVGGDNLITDTAQTPGDIVNGASPVADAATLVTDTGRDVSAVGGMVQDTGSDLSNPDVVQDVTNGLTDTALGSGANGGSSLVSADAGPSGEAPIANAGVLGTPDDSSPISVAAGNGPNVANVDALDGGSGDHLITGDAGAAGGTPITDAGVLTTPDSQSPLGLDVGNGPNVANASVLGNSDALQDATGAVQGVNGTGDSGDHLVTGDAGATGGSPVADAGVLTTPDSQSPLGLDVGNGPNVADASALTNGNVLQNATDALQGVNGTSDSGDHLVTGDAGAAGGTPVTDAGILTTPDSQSPIGADVGNGQNIANAGVLGNSDALQNATGALQGINGTGNSGDHLVTGDAGAAGGSPVADAGVLTTPSSQSPVGADVGNGQNVAAASLLSHSDALSFPNMGGAGTDALTGVVPSAIDVGNVASDSSAPATSGQSLVDAHTDGGPLVQLHDNSPSTVGVNDHALV